MSELSRWFHALPTADLGKEHYDRLCVIVTRIAKGLVANEREACAKIAEGRRGWDADDVAFSIATAIRARGEKIEEDKA